MLVDITASATQVAAAFSNSHSDRGSGNKSRHAQEFLKATVRTFFMIRRKKKTFTCTQTGLQYRDLQMQDDPSRSRL